MYSQNLDGDIKKMEHKRERARTRAELNGWQSTLSQDNPCKTLKNGSTRTLLYTTLYALCI